MKEHPRPEKPRLESRSRTVEGLAELDGAISAVVTKSDKEGFRLMESNQKDRIERIDRLMRTDVSWEDFRLELISFLEAMVKQLKDAGIQ